MSKNFFSAKLFSLAFGLGYAAAVYVNYPLFRYYPLVKRFSMSDLATTALGPAMSWFGWIAAGLVFGVVVAVLVPKRIGDRTPPWALLIVVALMSAAGWIREHEWFVD